MPAESVLRFHSEDCSQSDTNLRKFSSHYSSYTMYPFAQTYPSSIFVLLWRHLYFTFSGIIDGTFTSLTSFFDLLSSELEEHIFVHSSGRNSCISNIVNVGNERHILTSIDFIYTYSTIRLSNMGLSAW